MRKQYTKPAVARGFTLIELMVVLGIVMVIAAIAFPKLQGMMEGLKLRAAVTNINGLVQQTRIQSVRDNKSYTLKTIAANAGNGITLYIDTNNDGALNGIEPSIQLPTNMTVAAAGPGPLPPLVAIPPYITAGVVNLSFNERGLPCSDPPICRTVAPYVIFFSQARPSGTPGWASMTVTQSGRIKAYTFTGGAAGTWQ
jgi:prepilin-type N-terminal cleavage/methylation domain-containing protein